MNQAFSTQQSNFQLAWDSTSLGLIQECARKYYLSMLAAGDQNGYAARQESVHLTFGILYHGALERYDHARANGDAHEAALHKAVRWTLEATWRRELGRPWASDDPNKNRYTLLRSVVWYLDQFGENDPVETVTLANGKPAVELSFRLDLGIVSSTGESIVLCGHLDRVGIFQETSWVLDRKTTKSTIGNDFFDKFKPDAQFAQYVFAAKVLWNMPVKGIIVDGAQIAVTFSRFQRGLISFTDDELAEWQRDTIHYIRMAEYYAKEQYWPMNRKSCGNYGGCPFRPICSKPPAARATWLHTSYTKRMWDPLQVRGDI